MGVRVHRRTESGSLRAHGAPGEDRRMVMESADWLNHATEELLQQRRLLHADSDNHETVAKGNPEVKRINGSTNNTKYCLLVQ